MLYIAQQLGVPIAEVAVTWTEIEGTELNSYLRLEVHVVATCSV